MWLLIGLLTIGPRFGGAIDDAARYFKDAYDKVSVTIYAHSLSHSSDEKKFLLVSFVSR